MGRRLTPCIPLRSGVRPLPRGTLPRRPKSGFASLRHPPASVPRDLARGDIMRRFSGAASIFFVAALGCGAAVARADVLASSDFDVNPAPADTRLTHNADSTLTAHYNTLLDTDKVLFPLS